jgi:uncharacterized protein (TIGR00730 family)
MSEATPLRRIAVFCGSSLGSDPRLTDAAGTLARLLAEQGLGIVYGGASCGLMGLIADQALAAGGEVIGVLPRSLQERELAHRGLTQLHIVNSMHERKALMADLADGFVALPGGFGTLDEFCEVLTWAQLGIHAKPCGLLNVAGYYDAFLAQVERAEASGLMRAAHHRFIIDANEPDVLLARMRSFRPAAAASKWAEPVRP